MAQYPYEVCLSVSDFASFEECQEATEKAAEVARAEVRDVVGDRVDELEFGEPDFQEFDSTNPGHACGYFEVTISGPDDLVAAVEKSLE